jgi:hypothetical protein
MTTATTGAGLAVMRRAAERIGISLDEYMRRRQAGERNCPICRRWLRRAVYGSQTRCKDCLAGAMPVEHCVYLDDRVSRLDALVARARTRAEAEEMVRAMNRAALAGMPGVSVLRVPLYYCVSEGVGDEAD